MKMFEKVKNEIVWTLVPDYLKVLGAATDRESCENSTTNFIQRLAKLLLPDKKIRIGEPQDMKDTEENKEPLKQNQTAIEKNFVADVIREA